VPLVIHQHYNLVGFRDGWKESEKQKPAYQDDPE
jgi:hypothetical protein